MTFKNLPVELIIDILIHLPSSDILQLSLVSQQWNWLITKPLLWKYWLIHHYAVPTNHIYPIDGYMSYIKERTMIRDMDIYFDLVNDDSMAYPPARSRHGAGVIGDEIVLIAGHKRVGVSFIRCNDVWAYHVETGVFREVEVVGKVPVMSRVWTGVVGEFLYCFGGIKQDGEKLNKVFKLDLARKEWTEEVVSGSVPCKRCDPLGVVYGSKIVIVGGSDKDLQFPIDVYEYDTETKIWTNIPLMGKFPSDRIAACCARIGNMMYIYGGGIWDKERKEYSHQFSETYALNLDTYVWTDLNPNITLFPTVVNIFPVMFPIGNHLILDGGRYQRDEVETYIFDTVQCDWIEAKVHPEGALSNNCASASLHNGNVYLFGGNRGRASNSLIRIDFSNLPFAGENF